ncbi:MAG: hypothetical protein M3439_13115 [Chloroflexota bacterium]|nr:hypothetical protein [Chloroflexota bacterium]
MASIVFRTRWLAILAVAISLFAACGSSDDTPSVGGPGPPHPSPSVATATSDAAHSHPPNAASPAPGDAAGEMQVFLVASELVVGENRFAVGLVTPDNAIVDEAEVTFEYYDLSDPATPVSESEATAERLASRDGLTVIYAHERTFERAGGWGVRVDAHRDDGTTLTRNIRFEVLADSPSLAIGEQVPVIDSPTTADVSGDLAQITSASEPNPAFYDLSIADALANDKPTVVLFATPSFCQTRFCGPDYDILSDLHGRYGEQLNMIHVEVFSSLPNPAANNWQYAQPLLDFGLTTEPWLYVIDADGTVTWRVEGLFTEDEVVAALADIGVTD